MRKSKKLKRERHTNHKNKNIRHHKEFNRGKSDDTYGRTNRSKNRGSMKIEKGDLVGQFIGNERGYGFVEIEGQKEDIFIPVTNTNGAMNKDTVLVRIIQAEKENHRAEGKIIDVLERKVKKVVGTYCKSKGFGFVIADDNKISGDIYIPLALGKKAKDNDKVVVEITRYPQKSKKAEGKVIEILGKADDTNVDILAILREYDYRLNFPKAVEKEAKEMPQVVLKVEDGRKDLRDKEIFTIDGADTKDIDDAVSLEKHGDKYLLGVHIADVSHYVTEGSALNKEALKRGTSVYLIDTVIPMLPKELSNGICSLNPEEDRNALSIDILLDEQANILNSKIYKSVIRSKKKMTYDDVFLVVEKGEVPEGYAPFVTTLKNMKELALKLIEKRHNAGAIDFDIPESKILLDENDKVIQVKPYEITIANRMIEQFMVLANECIAKTFFEKQLPFLYRVHERPSEDKMQRLKIFLQNQKTDGASEVAFSEEVKPIEIQKVIENAKGKPEERVVSMMALRAMQLAKYSHENKGHFGLALENYCHFTSPIRRYPDLFIHRVISCELEKMMNQKTIRHFHTQALQYAEICSDREQHAEEAERDLDTLKKCEYMADHVGEEWEGIISGVTNFGIFVELENTIEGLVHVENMKDDYYNFDEVSACMVGERTKKIYKMGDKIKIRVLAADKLSKRIDFEVVQE